MIEKLALRILVLILSFSISVWIIIVLNSYSYKKNHKENDFIRLFPPHKVTPLKSTDLQLNSYYIAGILENTIYLGNITAPALLTKINLGLDSFTRTVLKFPSFVKSIGNGSRLILKSGNLFLMDGRSPFIFSCDLRTYHLTLISDKTPFSKAIPVSASSFVSRIYDDTLQQDILVKGNDKLKRTSRFVPAKQKDGIFSVDGILASDESGKNIFYTFYYRNSFYRLDSDLHQIYRANTIDTNFLAKIELGKLGKENNITFSSPPVFVNKICFVSDKYVYIHSSLKANNEDQSRFDEVSVIDVYNIESGKYRYSFYLENKNGQRISDFSVSGNTLVAITDRFLFVYSLSL